jgi:hypothetical protein
MEEWEETWLGCIEKWKYDHKRRMGRREADGDLCYKGKVNDIVLSMLRLSNQEIEVITFEFSKKNFQG